MDNSNQQGGDQHGSSENRQGGNPEAHRGGQGQDNRHQVEERIRNVADEARNSGLSYDAFCNEAGRAWHAPQQESNISNR